MSQTVFSVSQLNWEARFLLEREFSALRVEGEIASFTRAASGHLYFTLKDAEAQIRCVMFRNRARLLRLNPETGMQVQLRGTVSLYEARGEYQFIADHMEEAGEGALQRAFEKLKQKLSAEGLFETEHKQPVPVFPQTVGVVTSPSGAVIHDIMRVLKRRFPLIRIILFPVPVQGAEAPQAICSALKTAQSMRFSVGSNGSSSGAKPQQKKCNLLIVARGGGAPEDLQAFNDEAVARAMFACKLPIVSAVGHESDFTIADLVADLRAPTPSAAVEMISPDQQEWMQTLDLWQQDLAQIIRRKLERNRERLSHLERHLRLFHPMAQIQQIGSRLNELQHRLQQAQKFRLQQEKQRLDRLTLRLQAQSPDQRIMWFSQQLSHAAKRLPAAMNQQLTRKKEQLVVQTHLLETISPLATLARGYAVAQQTDGEVIRDATQVQVGESMQVRFRHGAISAQVKQIISE